MMFSFITAVPCIYIQFYADLMKKIDILESGHLSLHHVHNSVLSMFHMYILCMYIIYSLTCSKRSPLGQRNSDLKRGLIYRKFSIPGQEKGDLLIQVTV